MKKIILTFAVVSSTITYAQNTGVGTVIPQQKFHVDGAGDNADFSNPNRYRNDIAASSTGSLFVGGINGGDDLVVFPKTKENVSAARGITLQTDMSAEENSAIAIQFINENLQGSTWRMYAGSPYGYSGVQPNAFEIWEYPTSQGNISATCCRSRLVLQSATNAIPTIPVTINAQSEVLAQGFRGNALYIENTSGALTSVIIKGLQNFDSSIEAAAAGLQSGALYKDANGFLKVVE